MRAIAGDRRHDSRRRRAGADDQDLLALVVEILRPGLRVDDAALVFVHVRPVRRVALRVPVIALAHPQEVGGEAGSLAGVVLGRLDRPEIVLRSTSVADVILWR